MKKITRILSVALSVVLLLGVMSSCGEKAAPKKEIGLQVYSLRTQMTADAPGTLQKIADMGYTNLELANYSNGKFYGYEPADFKALVESMGMKITSSHINRALNLENYAEGMEWWGKAIEAHSAAGIPYMVMPSPPIRLEDATIEDLDKMIEYMEDIGVNCNSAGIRFGYHNHQKEFLKIGDTVIFDYLVQKSDPTRVFFQLDVYWCQQAGFMAVDLINKYANRIPLLHIKDVKEIGASGTMDFKAIFDAAYANGQMKEFFVEQEDYTGEPFESVKQSFDYLNSAPYVK